MGCGLWPVVCEQRPNENRYSLPSPPLVLRPSVIWHSLLARSGVQLLDSRFNSVFALWFYSYNCCAILCVCA